MPLDNPRELRRIADPDMGDSLMVVTTLGPTRGFILHSYGGSADLVPGRERAVAGGQTGVAEHGAHLVGRGAEELRMPERAGREQVDKGVAHGRKVESKDVRVSTRMRAPRDHEDQ